MLAHTEINAFDQSAFTAPTEVVDCTLEDGTATTCHRITVGYNPEGLDIGPLCPATLDEQGGIWDWDGENAGLYRIEEVFLRILDDLGYSFFDQDGTVHVVDTITRPPEVDHACINVAAECTVTITMLLPTTPVLGEDARQLGTVSKVGVALDGVPIFSDAPSVPDTGHMPALDTCGGHVDPGGWYHWHATSTEIETAFAHEHVVADCGLPQDTGAVFGYAFDGFPILGSTERDGSTPEGLDACNGHGAEDGYHYHATESFPNLPRCLVGVPARDNFSTTARVGIGSNPPDGMATAGAAPGQPAGGGPGGIPPGFEDAAESLGMAPEALMQALDAAGGPHADLDEVAEALGVDAGRLRAVLPAPPIR